MYEEKKTDYWMITAIVQWIIICLMMAVMYPTMSYVRDQLTEMRASLMESHKETESMQEEMRQFMNDNKEWQAALEKGMKKDW